MSLPGREPRLTVPQSVLPDDMLSRRRIAILASLVFAPVPASAQWLGPAPQLDPFTQPEAAAAAPLPKSVSVLTPIVTGSRAAVRNAYNTYFVPAMPAMGFTGSIAGCTAGTISTAFKEWTISRANYFRALTGLPGNVALDTDPTRESQQQAAAVLFSANQNLSHSPTNPPFTQCPGLLAAGGTGAANSNIALAFGSSTFDDVIVRYIDDSGTGNEPVGHRRWILYPPQASMTVGSTPTGANWGANALRVFNAFGSRPATPNGVAWPNAGYVPIQNLPGSKRWSWSFPGANFAAATVSMTADGAPIASTVISTTANFGDPTIVFVPTPAIASGTVYGVTISGITGGGAPASYSYSVRPFDPADPLNVSADFNFNGSSDLLWQNADGRAAIWLMNGLATAGASEILPAGTGFAATHIADFDGDGRADLLWQHPDGRAAVWLMNGLAPSATAQVLSAGSGWTAVHTPDLNGDGKADIVWQHTDGTTAVWLMNGTAMTGGSSIIGAGTGWSVARTGDFNADGRGDLLWTHTDGRVAIWLMNGTAPSATGQILNAASGWTAAHAADLDGDGRADIVWQHADGSVAAWLMNGTVMASGSGILGAGTGWGVAKTADFDSDGRSDLHWQHPDGRAAIWLMNGLVPAATAQILNAGGGWSAKRTADLNGDGKADIVWENVDGSVAVWLMNGAAMSSGSGILGPASGWSVSGVGP